MAETDWLVDPHKTRRQQEVTVLYIIAVANKTSEYATNVMGKFLMRACRNLDDLPFHAILELWRVDALRTVMRECKIAPYEWKYKAFLHAALVGTRGNTLRDLKSIGPNEWANVGGQRVGIGPKTSRYICMCLDPENARYAALDTHILKWLRHIGHDDAPKNTPPAGVWYDVWEAIFLDECDERGKLPAQLDAEVWEAYKYKREIPA